MSLYQLWLSLVDKKGKDAHLYKQKPKWFMVIFTIERKIWIRYDLQNEITSMLKKSFKYNNTLKIK